MIGFSYYDEPPSTTPTTQEILAALTAGQKTGILNGFALKTPVTQLKHEIGVHSFAIRHLYRKIDEIEERARALMRGEVIVTPGDPPTYNTPPGTSTALRDAIAGDFSEDFTVTQVNAVLTKMVQMSKFDGTGTWIYYEAEVVK